jgi:membrane protease YdiL (CAAX protease family)
VLPILGLLYWVPRVLRAPAELLPRRRMQSYVRIVLMEWGLVGALAVLWMRTGRSPADLGLGEADSRWGIVAQALVPAVAILLLWQHAAVRRSPELQESLRRRLGPLRRIMPATPKERWTFLFVALTAGICEELLYRGYLLFYLGQAMPLWVAVLTSAVIFGWGHAYQGPRGVLNTGLLGLLFAALYVISGTLVPLMIVHALVDVGAGELAYRLPHEPVEDAAPGAAPPLDPTPAA